MFSDPICVRGCGGVLAVVALVAVLSTIPGCGTSTIQPSVSPTVSMVAPDDVLLPDAKGIMTLPVSVRLHNHTPQEIKLFASTPCAVFRWVVVMAKHEVQSKPNQLCAQVVATDALWPGRQLSQFYEIVLDASRYTAGGRYRLEYNFWRYTGHHDFTIRK